MGRLRTIAMFFGGVGAGVARGLAARRRRRAIRSIRESAACLGYDLSGVPDGDIESGAVALSAALGRAGISARDAADRTVEAFHALSPLGMRYDERSRTITPSGS